MARPNKHTPEREALILNALRTGATRTDACAAAGINIDTLADWQTRDNAARAEAAAGLMTPERGGVAVLIELVRVANAPAFDLAEDLRFADGEQAARLVGAAIAKGQGRCTDQRRRLEVRASPAGSQGRRLRLGDLGIPTARQPGEVCDEISTGGLPGLAPVLLGSGNG
jgi:hypothetical protein